MQKGKVNCLIERKLLNEDFYNKQVVDEMRPILDLLIDNVDLAIRYATSNSKPIMLARSVMLGAVLGELAIAVHELLQQLKSQKDEQ